MSAEIRAIRGGEWWAIRCPYSAEWVEIVKRDIPHTQREWDEEAKEWRIVAEGRYLATVLRACRAAGFTAKLVEGDTVTVIRPDGTRETLAQGNLFG